MRKNQLPAIIALALSIVLSLSMFTAAFAVEPVKKPEIALTEETDNPDESPCPEDTAEPEEEPSEEPTIEPTLIPEATKNPAESSKPSPGAENLPPVAENLEITTYRCVSVTGKVSAVDPEGDLIKFELTTPPRKGNVDLKEDGSFVYTPSEGKKGKDYFGFRAKDSNGNCSQEATVIIRIEKQKSKVTYSDMIGNGNEYAALALAERDVFIGSRLGDSYMFEPNRSVSRGEFLAMCMKIADTQLLSGVTRTGFADDDSIPMWVKPYVSTALINGIVSGYKNDITGPVFDSEAAIMFSEAAVMLNRILNVTDVVSTSSMYEGSVPTWAYQATANLSACNVMPRNISSMDNTMTRADAAQMLLGAYEVLQARK